MRAIKEKTLRKRLHNKIWKIFSEYVRRESGGLCYTCGIKKDWKELHASHNIHNKLDYEIINIHACCCGCNTFKHGNLGIYGEKLIKEYGVETIDALRLKSNQIYKPSTQELEDLLHYWSVKLESLKSLKENL